MGTQATQGFSATCHCGAVRLTLPADAAGILVCHCADCRKMHGNFNAFVAAPCDAIEIEGAAALVWYTSSSAGRWLVSAGLIDGPTGRPIIRNLWAQSRPDWYAPPEAQA